MQKPKFKPGDIVRLAPGYGSQETGIMERDVHKPFRIQSRDPKGDYRIVTYPKQSGWWWANDYWLVRDEFMTALYRVEQRRVEQRRKYYAKSAV
jgi:hypothetical protein